MEIHKGCPMLVGARLCTLCDKERAIVHDLDSHHLLCATCIVPAALAGYTGLNDA